MIGADGTRPACVLDIVPMHLHAAQAKWDRLTADDYASLETEADLIAAVEDRYGLPHDQAARDVTIWLRDIGQSGPRR
jgi:hypothetical protein